MLMLQPLSLAQVTPDNTLGAENSKVTNLDQLRQKIDGGAIRGNSLFHSFLEFNVRENGSVYFSNPAGINNILSRITGGNASHILGTLGVLGNANLFLINPNGIIFGENATLDVKGSFYGTTSDSIQWGENGFFSAIEPKKSNLLSINPDTLFFNHAANHQGSIINRGNLQVGEDLTLVADNLDLQGQLYSEGNLTLHGLKSVKIRDTVANPFIAVARNNLLVRGNDLLDIFILNNPQSGLFSGKNMTFSSANSVIGDAHIWSGENFRIETLEGKLGNLYSPNDPIIRSLGNVEIFAYQGASLHIIAGGSVDINTIIITNTDTLQNSINPITTPELATVNLSDGQTIVIDGNKKPTVDIRAGVKPAFITGDFLTGNGNFVPPFNFTENPSSADIKIGDILMIPSGGQILLTNQFEPNTNLDKGEISLENDGFLGFNLINNSGGDIIVDSKNGIIVNGSFLRTSSTNDQGGNISLIAQEDIRLMSGASMISDGLTNGKIKLKTNQDILIEEGLISSSIISNSITNISNNIEDSIEINARSLTLTSGSFLSASTSGAGSAGKIYINLSDTLSLSGEDRQGFSSNIASIVGTNAEGNSGEITIKTESLQLNDGAIISSSTFGKGNSGVIRINATDLVNLSGIDSQGFGSSIFSIAGSTATGNSGKVIINTPTLLLNNGAIISASTLGKGDAGIVKITATDMISLSGIDDNQLGSNIQSQIGRDAEGSAGGIDINTDSLYLSDGAIISTSTLGKGEAGLIQITADKTISLSGIDGRNNESRIFSQVSRQAEGSSEGIILNTNQLTLDDGAVLSASTRGKGDAGRIEINAVDSIILSSRKSIGDGALIESIVASGAEGNSEGIIINTESLFVNQGSVLSSSTFGTGNAGKIEINSEDTISLSGLNSQGNISAIFSQVNSNANGNSGGISINSNVLDLQDGAKLSTVTFGEGSSGNIDIISSEKIQLHDSEISSSVEENATGNAQKITLNTANLNLNNSSINATTAGLGNAGSIETVNNQTINLDNSTISTEITNTGQATQPSNIIFNTQNLNLNNNSEITASTAGKGDAGNIEIPNGQSINLNQSKITASTSGQGNTGEINLEVSNQITLNNNSEISSSVEENAEGNAKKITLNTANVNLNNSQINATTAGLGNAGSIETFNNQTINLNNSSISTEITNTGKAVQPSNIILNTGQINLNNNSEITASTAGKGDAGNISIDAKTINLNNNSNILTIVEQQAIGEGGNINIRTSGNSVNLNNRSQISSRSQGVGNAGNIFIDSLGSIRLNDSDISTTSEQASGGEIRIFGSIMRFRGDSDISTNVNSGIGGGGDILLNANSIILYDDSDIFAFAQDGQGGNIILNTPVFFGEGYQRIRNQQNTDNLDNNNQVNLDASGAISGSIVAPDLTFIRNSLTELPSNIINTEQLIANTCVVPNPNQTGTFIITGSGGLPERPGNTNRSYYSTGSIQTLPNQDNASPSDSQIVEPQGVFKLPDGRRILSRRCSK